MRRCPRYDVFLFDCDGVVFDSNPLKIAAMRKVLNKYFENKIAVNSCVEYFCSNFGKSRFHHVDVFFRDYLLGNKPDEVYVLKSLILDDYSCLCRQLYLGAELTPGFLHFIESIKGKKYIVSGSEQSELREIFDAKGLMGYFDGVYGSPISKSENIRRLVTKHAHSSFVMFGDAIADLEASIENSIEFVAYLPCSTVKEILYSETKRRGMHYINNWEECL